ncbi:MAG TPA: ATP-dependent DNA helicase [Thermoplasmataceae archaeon]|nr:ATP-dependent DNA helicase [Thermoplasmataceae archaeon]
MDDTIVIANPGTGKTHTLAETAVNILRSGVSPEDMILTTFTNKAALEMKTRISKLTMADDGLYLRAMRIPVGTVHSHAYKILSDYGYDFQLIDQVDLRFILWKYLRDRRVFNYETAYMTDRIIPKLENAFRYLKSFAVTPDRIPVDEAKKLVEETFSKARIQSIDLEQERVLYDVFLESFRYYEEYKNRHNLIDYNDLLIKFIALGNVEPRQFVLVDEFQDLNDLQVRVIERLGRKKFVVGDRKQSIFGFQGGSLKSFRTYSQSERFRRLHLKQNRRSTNNILRYSSTYLLNQSHDASLNEELSGFENPDKDEGDPVHVIESEDPLSSAVEIALDLSQRNDLQRIGILARTNSQLNSLAELLDDAGVEYSTTMRSGANRFAQSSILTYLRGLYAGETESIVSAIFTPFSGFTLENAAKISKEARDMHSLEEALQGSTFWEMRKNGYGIEALKQAMDKVVLPISVSLGKSYLEAAKSISESITKYSENHQILDPDDIINYCRLYMEEEVELLEGKINLLTVHKAKGLEFDAVIYVPSEQTEQLRYFDVITKSILQATLQEDFEAELSEESLRIDYVAFTRARDALYIVTEPENNRYFVDNRSCRITTHHPSRKKKRLDPHSEAYALFVNGKHDEAMRQIPSLDRWLLKAIRNYIHDKTSVSFSFLQEVSNPLELIEYEVLNYRVFGESAEFGSQMHSIAQAISQNKISPSDVPERFKTAARNLVAVLDQISSKYSRIPKFTEYRITLPVNNIFPEVEDELSFVGVIDAVFESAEGEFLIVDYKTGRKDSVYWNQLYLYRSMFSLLFGIPENKITVALAYLQEKNSINTGRNGYTIEARQSTSGSLDWISRRLKIFLDYRNSPDLLVEQALSRKPSDEIQVRIIEQLRRETA